MKVNFIQEEKRDNKINFSDLKNGELFSFVDPSTCSVEVYMKVKLPASNRGSGFDTVSMSSGQLSVYSELRREAIATSDQMFVYKLNGKLDILVEN